MKLSTAVVAHTSREEMAKTLADTVDAQIFLDDGTLGCEANHLRVLQWHTEQDAPWALTLEDDAQPVDDFTAQLTNALAVAPTPIVSLYFGKQVTNHRLHKQMRQVIDTADRNDACWITATQLHHAVGVAIRTEHIGSLLQHHSRLPIDKHIGQWASGRHQICYTWPSLVDHADTPTLVRHQDRLPRPPGRKAWRTGGRQTWTAQSVTL